MNNLFTIVDQVERGYTKLPNAILRDPDLTDSAKVVMFFLLSITKDFHPTIKKISKTLHMSEKKVQRALTLLRNAGYISITRVKDGSLYGGMQWQISNFHGHFGITGASDDVDKIDHTYVDKIDHVENDQTCMDKNDCIYMDKNDDVDSDQTPMDKINYVENGHTSQLPIGQQPSIVNNQYQQPICEDRERVKNQQSLSPYPFPDTDEFFSGKGSSEATASPLRGKKPGQGEQVLSQTDLAVEQAFNRFCDVYPNLGDRNLARTAFLAIPDISTICHQIANSVEWFEKSGKWNNWQTGQKNVSCPQAAKFLKRGDWQQYLKSGATMSEEDRLRAILARNKNKNS